MSHTSQASVQPGYLYCHACCLLQPTAAVLPLSAANAQGVGLTCRLHQHPAAGRMYYSIPWVGWGAPASKTDAHHVKPGQGLPKTVCSVQLAVKRLQATRPHLYHAQYAHRMACVAFTRTAILLNATMMQQETAAAVPAVVHVLYSTWHTMCCCKQFVTAAFRGYATHWVVAGHSGQAVLKWILVSCTVLPVFDIVTVVSIPLVLRLQTAGPISSAVTCREY